MNNPLAWVASIDLVRLDQSLVVTTTEDMPFHVTLDHPDYPALYEAVADDVPREEEPIPEPPPTDEQILAALPSVSHAQIVAVLIERQIITLEEGMGWLTGTLPAAVTAVIAQLPADQQTIATLRAIRPTLVSPTDVLVAALAAAKGIATAGLIEIFRRAYAL